MRNTIWLGVVVSLAVSIKDLEDKANRVCYNRGGRLTVT